MRPNDWFFVGKNDIFPGNLLGSAFKSAKSLFFRTSQ